MKSKLVISNRVKRFAELAIFSVIILSTLLIAVEKNSTDVDAHDTGNSNDGHIHPTITSVTSVSDNGRYKSGNSITLRFHFSESVWGNATVNLNSGGSCQLDASTLSSADCIYTVGSSDNTNDLNVSSVVGSFTSSSFGYYMEDFIPGSNLAQNSDIVIDNTAPFIDSISSIDSDGYYNSGDVININIHFSEPVFFSSGGHIELGLDTGGTCIVTNPIGGNSSFTCQYDVLPLHNSSDLNIVSVSAISINDEVMNYMSNFVPVTNLSANKNIVIDNIAPFISSVTSDKPNGSYNVGEVIDINVIFNEVVNADNVVVDLETGSVDASCTFDVSNSSVGTCNYTIQEEDSGRLNALSISADSISDLAGNIPSGFTPGSSLIFNSEASLAANKQIVADNAEPNIVNINSHKPNGYYKVGDVIDIDVYFSEPVTSADDVEVALETGTTDRTCSFNVSNFNMGTCNYTVQAGDTTSDLNVNSISGTIADQAGNAMSSYTIGTNLAAYKALVIDTTAPIVSLTAPLEGSTVSGSSVSITANASDTNLVGVQFKRDINTNIGAEDTTSTYGVTWDTTALSNGSQSLIVVARDLAGNYATSTAVNVVVDNVLDTAPPSEEEGVIVEEDTPQKKGSIIQNVSNTFTSAVSRTTNRITNLFSDFTTTLQDEPQNEEKILDLIEKLKQEFLKLLESGEVGMTPLNQNPSQTFTIDLEIGDSNEEVRLLQVFLNSNGYIVAETGPGSIGNETTIFGPATQAALVRFQKDNNIIPSVGYFGPLTRNLINNFK